MNILKSRPVGIPERAFATFIDIIITFTIVILIHFFIIDQPIIVMGVILSLFYAIILPVLWDGYTIGKRLIGIRISHVSDGKLTIISIYLVHTRDDKRSIHDLLASTYVTSNLPEQE
ncbi:hypothetical protein GCM10011351_01000 [Paraliobacillus quinghaiensis]|uniref:RDD domain-containing protein n=1 Tax=Paraliobacillus quinghaiensis TaxID=470815 RepID=A0A917TE94_9BACI|nr:RDD family protein [Paraliobacillus quinghaiensis]GGM19018.1 hypothetical protein GCM10011351_01000 [Paraliobacillus quinghaiensis]